MDCKPIVYLTPHEMRIYKYMQKHGSITGIESARNLGILDYRKRISDMLSKGVIIVKDWETGENRNGEPVRFKRYYLVGGDGLVSISG